MCSGIKIHNQIKKGRHSVCLYIHNFQITTMKNGIFSWTPEGVKVTTETEVANGVQRTEIILNSSGEYVPHEFDDVELLHLFKEDIVYALKERIDKCEHELVNAKERGERKKDSWDYKTKGDCDDTFDYNSYKAMQEAIKLAEEEKFDEFTANMWWQTEMALAYIPKKWHHKPYTFSTLFEFVMEKSKNTMQVLINEKK